MATTTDRLSYQVIEGWEQLPAGHRHGDVVGVAVDSRDRAFIYTRAEARVSIYNRDGSFAASWGEGFFTARTHGLTIAPDDTVYCVDEGRQVIYHFTPDGTLLQTIGTPDISADTGYDGRSLTSITRGGPPFNRPTNLAAAPNGELYVSDGYGNARIHRFSAAGELLQSWGEPGNGPGQFNLPHGLAVLADERVVVADRENDRLQFFSPDGEYLDQWTDVQRPTNIAVDGEGRLYVSELWRRVGDLSFRLGDTTDDRPGRVSVYDASGVVLARWGGPDRCAPGNFCAPHDICVDSHGDVYVGEVTETFGVRPGLVPADCHTLQKFAREAS
ncbi:MAG: peptidyl-alpha-hydroxyglycine alpha-amidating lyase family protein [Thermomicrobiales bacterium]